MNRLFSLWATLGLVGCVAVEPEPESTPAEPPLGLLLGAADPIPGEPTLYIPASVASEEVGEATLLPPPVARTRVRMNVDQLEASLTSVLGGLQWVDGQGKSRWIGYYDALGVPDYMDSVREILQSTLLFDKLLGDAARDLCPQLLAQEKALPLNERVFLTQVELTDTLESSSEAVEENLSVLLLRFHGRYLPAGDERLGPWKTLFANLLIAGESTETAWTAVCVALLIHPEFSSR